MVSLILAASYLKEDKDKLKSNVERMFQILSQLTTANIPDDTSCVLPFLEQLDSKRHKMFVLLKKNTIIGLCTLLLEPKLIHNMSMVGHIEDVVLDKKEHGKGYGRYMVKHLIKMAKEKGCYKIILHCNDRMKPYYESLEFKHTTNGMSIYVSP